MFNKERYTAYIWTKTDAEIALNRVKHQARMIKLFVECGNMSQNQFSAYKRYIKKNGNIYRQMIYLLKSEYPRDYQGYEK